MDEDASTSYYQDRFFNEIKTEWDEMTMADQSAVEGKPVEFDLLISGTVAEARLIKKVIKGHLDPPREKITLLVMLTEAVTNLLEPEPNPDFASILAAAAVKVMELEDSLETAKERILQITGDEDEGSILDG